MFRFEFGGTRKLMRNEKRKIEEKQQKSYIHLSSFFSKFSLQYKYDRKLRVLIFSFSFFILRRIERIDGKKLDFSFLFMKKNIKC